MKTPIPHSYWVRPGKFLAGEYPGDWTPEGMSEKMSALRAAGVALFVDLTEAGELLPYTDGLDGADHKRMPIVDASIPSQKQMVLILDLLDDTLARELIPYVHCHGGIGRTGTVVGCWLARHGSGGAAGLRELRELWKNCAKSAWVDSPETGEQESFIRNWAAGL